MKKILIVSHDKIGENMAGPGIRYHYMAEVLSRRFEVTVGFFNPSLLPDGSFKKKYRTIFINPAQFQTSFTGIDVVIALWLEEDVLTYCHDKNIFMVFDVYAPVPVENLALFMFNGDEINANTEFSYRQSYALYEKFFQYGDLFLFSNRRQLDFWIGYVFGLGNIQLSSYIKRPVFERFIYAPMGIDTAIKIFHDKNTIRRSLPSIGKEDKIILWTGGIWNWFDAQTLIRAMGVLQKTNPEIKLVFFGVKHPNPNISMMREATETIKLSKRLGLYNKTVFVHEDWVPYKKRTDYLLEADAAVYTTKPSIEAEFAHRTRALDHIFTNLPTVATVGDYFSDEIISQKDIGITVPPNNPEVLSQAIIHVITPSNNKRMRENIKGLRSQFDWNVTLSPLIEALAKPLERLPHAVVERPKEIKKNTSYYRLAKRIIPKPVKRLLVRLVKYGR